MTTHKGRSNNQGVLHRHKVVSEMEKNTRNMAQVVIPPCIYNTWELFFISV